jgi:hypothetical protein
MALARTLLTGGLICAGSTWSQGAWSEAQGRAGAGGGPGSSGGGPGSGPGGGPGGGGQQQLQQHQQQQHAGGRGLGLAAAPLAPLAAQPGRAPLPPSFDWRAYLLRYPDLRAGGVRGREAAVLHYVDHGHAEARRYDRIPVLLRYTACQGLFNQMCAGGWVGRPGRGRARRAAGTSVSQLRQQVSWG